MPGLKIEINTKEAERASKLLRKELGLLGHEAVKNEKDFKKLEKQLLKGMGAKKAADTVDHLTHSLKLSRLETAKLQAKTGNLSGAFKTLLGRGKATNTMMKTMAKSAALLAGVYGVKKVSDSFIDAANKAESYRTRLTILLRSQAEGNRMFDEMADYAGRVPFEYEKVMQSATALSGVMKGGVDEVKEWMPLIGDLAVAAGLTIEETTSQMIKMYSAGASAADMLRDRGVTAMLGFTSGVKYSAEETRVKLMQAWKSTTSQFRGATSAMAKNWEGMVSMLRDAWFQFRVDVMGAGIFDAMKEEITGLLVKLKEMKEDGSLKEWAKSLADDVMQVAHNLKEMAVGFSRHWGTIKTVFGNISEKLSLLVAGFMKLPSWMQEVGILGSFLFGIKGALLIGFISYTNELLDKANDTLKETQKYKEQSGMMQSALEGSIRLLQETGKAYEENTGKIKGMTEAVETNIAAFRKGMALNAGKGGASAVSAGSFLQGSDSGMFGSVGGPDYAKQNQGALSGNGLSFGLEFGNSMDAVVYQSKDSTEEISKQWTELNESMASSFETGFANLFINGLDGMGDAFKQWGSMIMESFSRTVAQMITDWLFFTTIKATGEKVAGGVIGGLFSAAVAHTGWNVGNTPPATKTVNPAVFNGAQRYHDGLAGDEFPAILQKGETVLPKGTSMSSPGVSVNITNTGAAVDAEAEGPRFDGEKWVFDILLKAKRRGTPQARQLLGAT